MKGIYKKKAVVFAIVAVFIASMSTVSFADWTPGDGHKMHYPQLPDEEGWDVYATAGLIDYPEICLADDWNCSETGPVTDIHFWGSWKGGITGIINGFQIAIHEDIPASESSTGYSMPGTILWVRTFYDWLAVPIEPTDPNAMQGWYNPYWGEIIYDDHKNYFQYNIVDIIEPFYQIDGTIYWLSISAIVEYDQTGLQPLWGWKSSIDHWNDDAVYWDGYGWIEIWEPPSPKTDEFWAAFDMMGMPISQYMGGTGYYDDGNSLNGWYKYPSDWWNIWFYDHPLDYDRIKIIYTHLVLSQWIYGESWVEIAINWATDLWSLEGNPGEPPLPGCNEERYIERRTIYSGPAPETYIPIDYIYEILDYNPEWVSMDVMGSNFKIEGGMIEHTCLGSLDLAFVITGKEPCTPCIDVEKYVWADSLSDWVDADSEHDALDLLVGTDAKYLIAIHNDGTCCYLTDIYVYDFLDDSMEFVDASPYPDETYQIPGEGIELYWYFPGPLPPCNWINITVWAEVLGPSCSIDENYVDVNGYCEAAGYTVFDWDSAFVHAFELDFGDAPDPTYPTLRANNGARHIIVPGIFLGTTIDGEHDGQPTMTSLGDDNDGNDDEDGVVFISLAIQGNSVNTKVTASVAGFLDAWVDFNGDGDWADADEQIFVSTPLAAGVNSITFNVPAGAQIGTTYSRFRFSTAGGLSYTGQASDGEVEDYRVFILKPIKNIKMHWPQLPDLDNTGIDVDMFWVPLADDWGCTDTGPVMDIHFWGSFADDILPSDGPSSLTFQLTIHSNIPAGIVEDWSMPGTVLWSRVFEPGEYEVYQVADNNPEDWYDPATGIWLDDNHLQIYQYEFYIDEDPFMQEQETIYWLEIKDILPPEPDYTFGWKTTRIDLRWMDDATWLANPPSYWLPLMYPGGHEYEWTTLDLAFVITSTPLPELIVVTNLFYRWNMIAISFDCSVDKADLWVEYDGTDYTWADAVTEGIVTNTLFGWDRINQIYLFSDVLEPGCGYWLWAFHDCVLKVLAP